MYARLWKLNSMSLENPLRSLLIEEDVFGDTLSVQRFDSLSVCFLATILKTHYSVFSELTSKNGSFPNSQEINKKSFECLAFFQQLSCIDFGNCLRNIWYRSSISHALSLSK